MGSTNLGLQTASIQYGSQVASTIVENLTLGLLPVGIYSGGSVTATAANAVSVSPLVCSISDGTNQIRIQTANAVALTGLASTNPTYIVLRWAYSASPTNYMDVLAITTAPNANDLLLATLTGVGTSIVVSYLGRSNSSTFTKNLLVEQMEVPGSYVSPSMYVHFRGGKFNTGVLTVDLLDQAVGPFAKPTVSNRTDVIGVNLAGSIVVIPGVEGAGVPVYGTVYPLAEITFKTTDTTLVESMIRNVRHALKGGGQYMDLATDQTASTGVKTFAGGLVIEGRTNDTVTQTGRIWLRTDL